MIFPDVQTLVSFWIFSAIFCILPVCVAIWYFTDWTDEDKGEGD